jgi:hypothetical protein
VAAPEAAAVSLARARHSGGAMAAAGHEEEQAVIADCRISNVINWNKPFRTTTLFAATTAVYW